MSSESQNHFRSHDFALRAQKKILSQFSSRKAAKVFISDQLSTLLDLLYQLIKSHTGDKKTAEKFVKNIIKLSIKVGILVQNDQFSKEELHSANLFAEKWRTIIMTITSFTEVDYSYDRSFLLTSVNQCEKMIKNLVQKHLTDKSMSRIQFVADQLKDASLLDKCFKKGSPENEIMIKMVAEINKSIESGDL